MLSVELLYIAFTVSKVKQQNVNRRICQTPCEICSFAMR